MSGECQQATLQQLLAFARHGGVPAAGQERSSAKVDFRVG